MDLKLPSEVYQWRISDEDTTQRLENVGFSRNLQLILVLRLAVLSGSALQVFLRKLHLPEFNGRQETFYFHTAHRKIVREGHGGNYSLAKESIMRFSMNNTSHQLMCSEQRPLGAKWPTLLLCALIHSPQMQNTNKIKLFSGKPC